MLTLPEAGAFTGLAGSVAGSVSLKLHEADGMFTGNSRHYLTCGASALNVIGAAVERAGIRPRSILDFGAGAGRVTRWLRAAYPEAQISATEIRAEVLAFCEQEFKADTFQSSVVVEELSAPRLYDLIWVGSVVTHLPEDTSERLVRKLLSWLEPDGVLVTSFHGRFVEARAASFDYGIRSGWDKLVEDLRTRGFGYADYAGQPGYGISICTQCWVTSLVERLPGARLVLLCERGWDGHQDVVGIQNRSVTEGLPQPA